MPTISEFYGIVIMMHIGDHAPPHFHAEYGGHEVVIHIRTLNIWKGSLPPKQLGRVIEWAALRQQELLRDWHKAEKGQSLDWIEPLA